MHCDEKRSLDNWMAKWLTGRSGGVVELLAGEGVGLRRIWGAGMVWSGMVGETGRGAQCGLTEVRHDETRAAKMIHMDTCSCKAIQQTRLTRTRERRVTDQNERMPNVMTH